MLVRALSPARFLAWRGRRNFARAAFSFSAAWWGLVVSEVVAVFRVFLKESNQIKDGTSPHWRRDSVGSRQ